MDNRQVMAEIEALVRLAEDDSAVDEGQMEERLRALEAHMRQVTDRTLRTVGAALTTIAQRNERLEQLVLEVIQRLGPIDVDPTTPGHSAEELLASLRRAGTNE